MSGALEENCPSSFFLRSNFPLSSEHVETSNYYVISTTSQSTAGPNGCVTMRTKIDYYLYKKDHTENIGTPHLNDTLAFDTEIFDELLNNPVLQTKPQVIRKSKSDMGIQVGSTRKKVKKKIKKVKYCDCKPTEDLSASSRSLSNLSEISAEESDSDSECKCD